MLVRLGRHGEAIAEYENAICICSKRLGRKHAMIAHLKGQVIPLSFASLFRACGMLHIFGSNYWQQAIPCVRNGCLH